MGCYLPAPKKRTAMKSTFLIILGCSTMAALYIACFTPAKAAKRPASWTNTNLAMDTSFFDFTVASLEGQPVALSQYKGKKIILLNVASKCGYTPQYADWERFYEANKEEVVVLGFPCNEFMGQEPGSAADIAEFCQRNYGVTFPMFEKVHVKKGPDQAPLYQWLTDPALNGWNSQEPSWNFCKYLINENGELTHFFPSKTKPDSQEFLEAMGL